MYSRQSMRFPPCGANCAQGPSFSVPLVLSSRFVTWHNFPQWFPPPGLFCPAAAAAAVCRYEDLVRDEAGDLHAVAERAFGHQGLGIVVVTGVPDIAEARRELFALGHK